MIFFHHTVCRLNTIIDNDVLKLEHILIWSYQYCLTFIHYFFIILNHVLSIKTLTYPYSNYSLNIVINNIKTFNSSSIVCCSEPINSDGRRWGNTCISSHDPGTAVGCNEYTLSCHTYPIQATDSPRSCCTSYTTSKCLLTTTIQQDSTIGYQCT